MKRQTVFHHLKTICERLDQAAACPENASIAVSRAWLFGSVLTEKAEPEDIDLIFEVDSTKYCRKNRSASMSLETILKNYHRALAQYAAGMKMVRINDFEVGEGEPGWWFATHGLPSNTPYYLVWQQGINWQGILHGIQDSPLPYDAIAEKTHKQENMEKSGIQRIEPVMRLIRRKYHLRKHARPEAIYEPLRTHEGFRMYITSDCCPENLKHYLQNKPKLEYDGFHRSSLRIAEIHWIWKYPIGEDRLERVVGMEIALQQPFQKSILAQGWVIENLDKLFSAARIGELPYSFRAAE